MARGEQGDLERKPRFAHLFFVVMLGSKSDTLTPFVINTLQFIPTHLDAAFTRGAVFRPPPLPLPADSTMLPGEGEREQMPKQSA